MNVYVPGCCNTLKIPFSSNKTNSFERWINIKLKSVFKLSISTLFAKNKSNLLIIFKLDMINSKKNVNIIFCWTSPHYNSDYIQKS